MSVRRTASILFLALCTALSLAACGGGGSDAPAPPPAPTVNTTAASAIATDNATINGTVNPNAQATTAWLEWGTDNALSSFTKTADQLIGAGSTAVTVSATITGLNSGTPYYYRAAASNASGTQKGAITSFTTASPNSPPTVVTIAADNITITGATLHGSVIPNELATTAWFEWDNNATLTTFSSTPAQSMGSGKISVPISAVVNPSPSSPTTYYFRVAATNSIGTSKGNILSFSTVPQAPTVTTQAATSITASGATLNGNVNPNGLQTSAHFEYGKDNNMVIFSTTLPQNMFSGTTGQALSTPVAPLDAATRYYFRVSATNSVGTTKGTTVFFDTLQNPPPTADAGPSQTVFMGQTVTLDGSASTPTPPATSIVSYQWTQIAGPTVGALDNTNPAKPKFTAPAVTYPSQDVQFQLTVTDNRGLTSPADTVTITVKWGFFDDFSTNTLSTYTITQKVGTAGTVTYDVAGQRLQASAPNDDVVQFSHSIPSGNQGVFSLDFNPTTLYPSHGGIWIRLVQSANTYYEVKNFDWPGGVIPPGATDLAEIRRVVGGATVDNVSFPTGYDQGFTYPIKITYSATQVVMEAFGRTVTLPLTGTLTVSSFEVETGKQDAFYDNIKLEARP